LFRDERFRTQEVRVWPRSGTADHRPLFARFLLLGEEQP
jgi:hypothetical protein